MDERLHKIREMVDRGIDEITSKGSLDKDTVCLAGELVDIRKDLSTIEAMEESGYSEMYPYYYEDGMSMRRGRYSRNDGMRRRTSYRDYSRNDLVDHLEEMMRNATTDHEREKYRKMILDAEKD